MWMRALSFLVLAVALGVIGSYLLWISVRGLLPKLPDIPELGNSQYSGVLLSINTSAHIVRLRIPSSYSFNDSPSDVEVPYDDRTAWWSKQYEFKQGVVEHIQIARESARELPQGALVFVWVDPFRTGTFYAHDIVLVKRKDL